MEDHYEVQVPDGSSICGGHIPTVQTLERADMIFIQSSTSFHPLFNRIPICISTLSPNSLDHGNEKSSATGAHIFSFPLTLEEREKEVRRCGWCTLFILDKVQTKRKKRNKNIYINGQSETF